MENCISKVTNAPLVYLSQIHKMKWKELILSGTIYSPAFGVMVLSSLVSVLSLAGFMLYFFLTAPRAQGCFGDILAGVYALAILYPIESIFVFVCLFGSVARAQSDCWKLLVIIFFGPVLAGVGFGGLGIVYLCLIQEQFTLLIPTSFLTQPLFVQIVVYTYLSLVVMYLIVVPTVAYMHHKQTTPNDDRTCLGYFCCIIYYILQILLMASFLFVLLLKITGPFLMGYILFEISKHLNLTGQIVQEGFYIISIIACSLPITVFASTMAVKLILRAVEDTRSGATDANNTTKGVQGVQGAKGAKGANDANTTKGAKGANTTKVGGVQMELDTLTRRTVFGDRKMEGSRPLL